MIGADVLRAIADLGGLGVLALFIIVSGIVIKVGLDMFKSQILPMVRNHAEHLAESYDRLADAIDSMKTVQEAMGDALDIHNALTRDLIERLPKNNRVKKLLDGS